MAESIFRGTTICAVRRNGECAMAGDGQVTMGQQTVMKAHAHKVRRIYNGKVVVGFAGSVADAFALSEKFEEKLTQFSGNLPRAAVELAQDWRMDKAMRKLEAMLLCADKENLLLVSGTGEVIEPDGGICAIGSGGNYALAAARALYAETDYGAEEMFLRSRGSLRVRMDLADSDFQAFMSGDEDAICQFQGVFMQQYSWAEPMVCTLQEKKELMLARMGKHHTQGGG